MAYEEERSAENKGKGALFEHSSVLGNLNVKI
jgi:hypothetical protein